MVCKLLKRMRNQSKVNELFKDLDKFYNWLINLKFLKT